MHVFQTRKISKVFANFQTTPFLTYGEDPQEILDVLRPDIVVMEFSQDFQVTDKVSWVKLPTGHPIKGLGCTISGWGSILKATNDEINTNNPKYVQFSDVLKLAKVSIINIDECERKHKKKSETSRMKMKA